MSVRNPIVAITGSSGAGTSTVLHAFRHIFRREKLRAQIIHGDSFHRFDREEMNKAMKASEKRGNKNFYKGYGAPARKMGRWTATGCAAS